MSVKLLTEHNLEFLSLKGGYSGSSESTHVKMPHCCKSHVMAQYRNDISSYGDHCKMLISSYSMSFAMILPARVCTVF